MSGVAGRARSGQNRPMTNPPRLEATPAQAPGGGTPGLTVAAVAKRLGVAPATLRTWDRRYGLGPSEHMAGSHRRYSEIDLARLVVMRRLALDGVAPQDAARAALAADLSGLTREVLDLELRAVTHRNPPNSTIGPATGVPARAGLSDPGAPGAPSDSAGAPNAPRDAATARITDGGRSAEVPGETTSPHTVVAPVLHLPSVGYRPVVPTPSAVVDAVLAGKDGDCEKLFAIDPDDDPARWWTELLRPAVERLATRTVLARPGEAPETLLEQRALRAIRDFVAQVDERVVGQGRPRMHPSQTRNMVLVFVAPGDPQPLAAHALAASLLSHGAVVRIVTGPANEHRVLEVVAMVRPRVAVMVTDLMYPELGLVHAIHQANPDLPILVGLKADVAAAELPLAPSVVRVRSFSALLHEVLAVVGLSPS